jgi:hypothetical protein
MWWGAAGGTTGVVAVSATALVCASGIYAASRRHHVSALNVNDVSAPSAPARAVA